MSVFKVGDRVRIKAAYGVQPRFVGKEAVITAFGSSLPLDPPFKSHAKDDCVISIDGELFGARQESLEPLTPPGQKEFKAEDILTMPNLPDFKTMTPEFARAWGGA